MSMLLKSNFHLFDILTLTILLILEISFSKVLCLLSREHWIDTPQIVHNASTGSGVIYSNGNGKEFGITSSSGKSMAWDDVGKSGDNDAEFFITFSSAGFQNINLYFDIWR